MKTDARLHTKISTKGQVILPKIIRDNRKWSAGTELEVVDTPAGVLLTPKQYFAPTKVEDVAGCLGPRARAVSIEEMNSAVDEHFRERWGHEYDDLG